MVKMAPSGVLSVALLLLLLPAVGCFVDVRSVTDRQGRLRASAGGGSAATRAGPGRAHDLEVLVYDAGRGQADSGELPLWLVRKCRRHHGSGTTSTWATTRSMPTSGTRLRKRQPSRSSKRRRVGTLVEVEEEDGAHVLVWLRSGWAVVNVRRMEPSDRDLMARLAAGDREALSPLDGAPPSPALPDRARLPARRGRRAGRRAGDLREGVPERRALGRAVRGGPWLVAHRGQPVDRPVPAHPAAPDRRGAAGRGRPSCDAWPWTAPSPERRVLGREIGERIQAAPSLACPSASARSSCCGTTRR